jgi:hypothetical protein
MTRALHTDPKSSVDVLEHVTNGGVHVQTPPVPPGERSSSERLVAVVQSESYSQTRSVPTRNPSGSSNVMSKSKDNGEG